MENKATKEPKKLIEYGEIGSITGDICKKTTFYRGALKVLPYLVGASCSKLNPFSPIAGIAISFSTIEISKRLSKFGIEKVIDKDGKRDGILEIKMENDSTVLIPINKILHAAVISQTDYVLLEKMIKAIVNHEIQKNKQSNKENDGKIGENDNNQLHHNLTNNLEENAIQVSTVERKKFKRDENKIDNALKEQLKSLKSTSKISNIVSMASTLIASGVFKGIGFSPTSSALLNTIIYKTSKRLPKKISDRILHRKMDKEDGETNNLVGKLPATTALELEKLTEEDTELYSILEEIIETRQEEMKVDIDNLYQGREVGQKIANILSKNKLLMKIWFIKDFVTKQTLTLPPARINRFGERVYDETKTEGEATIRFDEKGNIIRSYTSQKFANYLSENGKLRENSTQEPTSIENDETLGTTPKSTPVGPEL